MDSDPLTPIHGANVVAHPTAAETARMTGLKQVQPCLTHNLGRAPPKYWSRWIERPFIDGLSAPTLHSRMVGSLFPTPTRIDENAWPPIFRPAENVVVRRWWSTGKPTEKCRPTVRFGKVAPLSKSENTRRNSLPDAELGMGRPRGAVCYGFCRRST